MKRDWHKRCNERGVDGDIRRKRRNKTVVVARAFTLIELMVVIAIVAVLAVIAVVAYRSVINSSRTAEATQMLGSIRTAQEAYHAETQSYLSASNSLLGAPYPSPTPKYGTKTGWGGQCSSGCTDPAAWQNLNVHADGPVLFGYTTVAGVAGQATSQNGGVASLSLNGTTIAFPTKPATDWFLIGATCDVDGLGGSPFDATLTTNVFTSSFSNEVWIVNEGK